MSGNSADQLEPRICEVLDAIEAHLCAPDGRASLNTYRVMHDLLLRLTGEELDQVRFILAQVGGRDS